MLSIATADFYNFKPVSEQQLSICMKENNETLFIHTKITEIINELSNIDITSCFVALPMDKNGLYWSDYPTDYIQENYNITENYMCFIVYLNKKGNKIKKPYIVIQRDFDRLEKMIKVIEIIQTHLKDYFVWSGSSHDTMKIYFTKQETQPDIVLKEDDSYPMYTLSIQTDDVINLMKDYEYFHQIYDKIKELLNVDIKDFSYGIDDIEITVYGLKNKPDFERIKEYLIGNKIVTSFKQHYYLDSEE